MKIQKSLVHFIDIALQNKLEELKDAIDKVFANGMFVLGEEVSLFENDFKKYCQTKYCVAVNSGTDALFFALLAAGIKPEDEVITTPLTFIATVAAICHVGAKPIFVDICPDTYTINPAFIESAITDKTRAILPVHLYGHPADMDPILEIARRYNLSVIEDCAQAHGALYKGNRVGSLGDMGCFSFYPSKNLGGCGDGGAVVTNNYAYHHTLWMLHDSGCNTRKYEHQIKGYNSRMDTLQAAILRCKLRHLEEWNAARRNHAMKYAKLLEHSPLFLPLPAEGRESVYHLYVVRSDARDSLQEALEWRGVKTGIHYPIPAHLQEGYRDLGYQEGDFPQAEQAAREVLSLPMYPELTEEQVEMVANAILEVV